jgi:large subunit ribosomal protein L28
MATKITDKKPLFGNNRSHALNATRRRQNLNMQQVTLSNGDKVMTTVREAKKYKKAQKEA